MRNKNAKVSDPNSFVTDPGSEIHILYSGKVMPDGSIQVVESGKENIQEKIESMRESTDMAYILKQLALGNGEVLQQSPGQYGDFTKAPKTMAEALQIQIDAENAWNRLPVDIRAKFDHDMTRWLVNAGTDDWMSKMALNNNSGEALVASEKDGENGNES